MVLFSKVASGVSQPEWCWETS